MSYWKSSTVSKSQVLYGIEEVKLWMSAEVEAHVKAYKSDLAIDFVILDDVVDAGDVGLYFYAVRKHGTHFILGSDGGLEKIGAIVKSFPDAVLYAMVLHQGYFDGFYAEVCRVDFVDGEVAPRKRWTFRKPSVPSNCTVKFDFVNTETGEVFDAPDGDARYEVVVQVDDGDTLMVCDRCLEAIESREGSQVTKKHWLDEDDDGAVCGWCGATAEDGLDLLYEIL